MKRIDESHSFSVAIAILIGIEKAIILKDMRGICIHNMSNGKHVHGGRAWMFNSARALAEKYPYMSQRSIARWLDEMERDKWIESANFNNQGFDRTKWYSVDLEKYAEAVHQYMNQNGESICQNGQCSSQNGESTGQDGEPYPSQFPSQFPSQDSLSTREEENFDKKNEPIPMPEHIWGQGSETRLEKAQATLNEYFQENPHRIAQIAESSRNVCDEEQFRDELDLWLRRYADDWQITQNPVKALTSGRGSFISWLSQTWCREKYLKQQQQQYEATNSSTRNGRVQQRGKAPALLTPDELKQRFGLL